MSASRAGWVGLLIMDEYCSLISHDYAGSSNAWDEVEVRSPMTDGESVNDVPTDSKPNSVRKSLQFR